jgi:3-hydroxyisobutyrate dehydrogenase-like beta-hydroxyacid dehydrogenase
MKEPIIGIAGCGSMGLPMAKQLLAAGENVWGYDIRPTKEFGDFQSRMIPDPAEFGTKVDILISVVRNHQQTLELCFDDQALFTLPNHPKTFVCSSTLSPRVLPDILDRLPQDVAMVDAAMSGAPARAESGTLTFMVGGEFVAVECLTPLFKIMGTEVNHLGFMGSGMTCKVINNFVAITGVAAVRKAIAAAIALGMDPKTLLDIMKSSSGSTWYGDNIDRISWSREGYDPGNTIGIIEKDMLSFLDAVTSNPDVEVKDFAASVLEVVRSMEPLDF